MKTKMLVVILALGIVCAWGSTGAAGDIGYRFRQDSDAGIKTIQGAPSSGVMAADAIIGRPLGLVTTIAGTAAYLVLLPFSGASSLTNEAAWGLVGRPAGWTFVRPLGHGAPVYEERGLFRP